VQKKALGKGLDALFDRSLSAGTAPAPSGRMFDLDVRKIIPNKYQPRKVFKEQALAELAASMKGRGVLQPVLVRRDRSGQYELIAGERRWRAARLAGIEKIPVVLQDASDQESMELALIENVQRQDLNPIEAGTAYRRLLDEFGLTQEEVAGRVGKERSSVANALRLLGLPPEIKDAIVAGQLSAGHAKVLLSLSRSQDQVRLARRIIRKGLSVRAAEGAIKRLGSPAKRPNATAQGPLAEAEQRIMRHLGTRVLIKPEKEGGRITIQYYSTMDLDRLIGLILE